MVCEWESNSLQDTQCTACLELLSHSTDTSSGSVQCAKCFLIVDLEMKMYSTNIYSFPKSLNWPNLPPLNDDAPAPENGKSELCLSCSNTTHSLSSKGHCPFCSLYLCEGVFDPKETAEETNSCVGHFEYAPNNVDGEVNSGRPEEEQSKTNYRSSSDDEENEAPWWSNHFAETYAPNKPRKIYKSKRAYSKHEGIEKDAAEEKKKEQIEGVAKRKTVKVKRTKDKAQYSSSNKQKDKPAENKESSKQETPKKLPSGLPSKNSLSITGKVDLT